MLNSQYHLDHICVCICTYKRPGMLLRLLESLQGQVTRSRFTYSVVVVDNDAHRSAQAAVESFKGRSGMDVRYGVEPIQNISLARNRAVSMAEGQYLAFIDDDEFPGVRWLYNLYDTCVRYKGHCVLGPVEPFYEIQPPRWVVRGRLCDRNHFETGTPIRSPEETRTGNVLVAKDICMKKRGPFDPGRGRTGGEDHEFFQWVLENGNSIFWCNEAAVYESVPAERLKRSYFLKRGLLRGSLTGKEAEALSSGTFKSLLAVGLYSAALPLLALLGHHLFMRTLMKSCDHLGKLLGLCGIQIMRERTF